MIGEDEDARRQKNKARERGERSVKNKEMVGRDSRTLL
jgi:hypothetical protein